MGLVERDPQRPPLLLGRFPRDRRLHSVRSQPRVRGAGLVGDDGAAGGIAYSHAGRNEAATDAHPVNATLLMPGASPNHRDDAATRSSTWVDDTPVTTLMSCRSIT